MHGRIFYDWQYVFVQVSPGKEDISSYSLSLPYGGLVIASKEYINLTKAKLIFSLYVCFIAPYCQIIDTVDFEMS